MSEETSGAASTKAGRRVHDQIANDLTAIERQELTAADPVYGRITNFLYREADLVDCYRFTDWLALFTEDIEYRMPVRTTRFLRDGQGFTEMEFFSENHASLATRVKRLETEFAWAEAPPSRTRHFVTNILAFQTDVDAELAVRSNFMVTRTRSDLEYQLFTGVRHDVVRQAATDLQIARRTILIDQTVITATNLSILF